MSDSSGMGLTRAREILADLIAFPTVSAESNLALIDYVDTLLKRAGAKTARVFNTARTKANLFASIGPDTEAGILVSGHTDVVPVLGQPWTRDPFRLSAAEGRLYGRGTADMKGFIACALAQAEALAGRRLHRPYQMAFSYDEEIGCVGVRSLIENFSALSRPPQLCVIGEPTSMRPAIAHKGKIAGRVTCTGRECHSAQAREGLNAIYLATDMIGALRAEQARVYAGALCDEGFPEPWSTLHVGVISGGAALNIVPRDCAFDFEIRNIPTQSADDLLAPLFDRAAALTAAARLRFGDAGVKIDIVNRYPGLATPAASPAVRRVQDWAAQATTDKIAFGTEGGLFHEGLGIAAVICGPGNIDQAHKPDEFIEEAQLAACLAFLDRLGAELVAA